MSKKYIVVSIVAVLLLVVLGAGVGTAGAGLGGAGVGTDAVVVAPRDLPPGAPPEIDRPLCSGSTGGCSV